MYDFIINTTSKKIETEDINNICDITFKKLKVKNPIFDIVIVDNKKIREINKKYRGKDEATDVISFAFEEIAGIDYKDARFLGEIYISIDKAQSQAKEYNHSLKREICFLTVHGLLHLLGYDHINEKDRKKMREVEESVLESYDAKR